MAARIDTGRARTVVLAIVLSNVAWSIGLPLSMVRWSSWFVTATAVALVIACAISQAVVLWAAVTPWSPEHDRPHAMAALVALTAAAWLPLHSAARADQTPWAWLAAFTVGCAVLRWPRGWPGVAAGAAALSVAGALLLEAPVGDSLLVLAIGLVAVGGMTTFVVWMLRLLVAVEAGRAAERGLAVSEERLRVAADLHDVLGSRLTVIALKAELVTALLPDDVQRARSESEQVRELTSRTLAEARAAVHGYGVTDLAGQLDAARSVLASAGIDARVHLDPAPLAREASALLGAAVREGVTNVLRHSDATSCVITLQRRHGVLDLTVVNDRPRRPTGSPGMGLDGLVDRAARLGGTVAAEWERGAFELRVTIPASVGGA